MSIPRWLVIILIRYINVKGRKCPKVYSSGKAVTGSSLVKIILVVFLGLPLRIRSRDPRSLYFQKNSKPESKPTISSLPQ